MPGPDHGSVPGSGGRVPARRCIVLLTVALALTTLGPGLTYAAPSAQKTSGVIAGQYVVTYRHGATATQQTTTRLERKAGFRARHRFNHVLKGFSAGLSPAQLAAVKDAP